MTGEVHDITEAIKDAPTAHEGDTPPSGGGSGSGYGGGMGAGGPYYEDSAFVRHHGLMPIRALGVNGGTCYYLDGKNQLRALTAKEHSKLNITNLFQPETRLPHDFWPRPDKNGNTTSFHADKAAEDMMQAASIAGIFDPSERLRGRGCWRDDDGGLVMHCGNHIFNSKDGIDNPRLPGAISGYVYPGAPAGEKPENLGTGGKADAGNELLALIRKWHFARRIDAKLVFGWICAAILGGALPWRPVMWLTGGAGQGKSTLQDVVTSVVGNMVRAGNATAASIWQNLGYQTLPVQLDELEASEDNRKVNSVVELARVAASGDLILRGGSDHVGTQFQARSCFLFSSILIPPISSQDRSRMAIIELQTIPDGAAEPVLDRVQLARIGRALRLRFFEEWHRFDETLSAYRRHMVALGHSNRTADVFGNLLAAADLALYDQVPDSDSLDESCADLRPANLHELVDMESEQMGCLKHLLTSSADPMDHGSRLTVAEMIERAAGREKPDDVIHAGKKLQRAGLRVMVKDGKELLLVANSHQGLMQIFKETRWKGRPGDAGVWVQALGRIEGAFKHRPTKFAGVTTRCLAIPLELVLGIDEEAEA